MYLLDTNIISFINLSGKEASNINKNLNKILQSNNKIDLFISAISVQEIHYGIKNAQSIHGLKYKELLFKNLINFIEADTIVIEYTAKMAIKFAEIKTKLNRKGFQVDDKDLMIAATAVEAEFTLVTNNTKDFKNISGLIVEDWTVF